jgi:hypothetical protein
MAIRKSIATLLSAAATRLEHDTSKEQASKLINDMRVGLANAIMPKQPLVK